MTSHERLRLAREALALDQVALAQETGISERKLASYEKGSRINSDDLSTLGEALKIGWEFLQNSDPVVDVRPVSPDFNKLNPSQQATLVAQARIWLDRYYQLESLVEETQEEALVTWKTPNGFPRSCGTGLDAANAAQDLRNFWGLGIAPIRNVTYLLEDRGLKVGLAAIPGEFMSCAFIAEDKNMSPVILIQQDLPDGYHRYELSKELAYFLLDRAPPQLAGHFAGGFLIPSSSLHRDLGHKRSELAPLEVQFLTIKHGVSWRTLLARATALKIISKEHYDEWVEEMGDDDSVGAEQADPSKIPMRMFELALRLETEGQIDEDQRSTILNLPWLEYA